MVTVGCQGIGPCGRRVLGSVREQWVAVRVGRRRQRWEPTTGMMSSCSRALSTCSRMLMPASPSPPGFLGVPMLYLLFRSKSQVSS